MRKKVLYVEDHKDCCDALLTVLEHLGCSCSSAGTVSEALKVVVTDTFDLIILDEKLPDGTGTQLCKAIRSRGIKTPILFYTAEPDTVDKPTARAAGAQAYLVKPDHNEQLIPTIENLLGLIAPAQQVQN